MPEKRGFHTVSRCSRLLPGVVFGNSRPGAWAKATELGGVGRHSWGYTQIKCCAASKARRQHNSGQTMDTSLVGKVALVAGATRGAGRGIAVQLGAAGATVYVTGRTS